jgi:putative ABC transport system permease protein
MVAIRYQIVVMLMLVASTCLGALFTVEVVRRRCFTPGQALV